MTLLESYLIHVCSIKMFVRFLKFYHVKLVYFLFHCISPTSSSVLGLILGSISPVLVGSSSPVRHLTQSVRLGEWLIGLQYTNINNCHSATVLITLTMSLNWAGMVFGPHPVGLSWIIGGSNLAMSNCFNLKEALYNYCIVTTFHF